MFHLYHHHDLDRLADLLAVLLGRRERSHILEPDTVIVPNRGVGRWLQMQLAGHRGVAANLAMPLPARFIWQLIPQLLPGSPDSAEFERHRMRWHLYALLPELARAEPAIGAYLSGVPRDVYRLQLAGQLADVFDQYLIYRPGLLSQWQAGRETAQAPDHWQAVVWRTLTQRLGDAHRAALLQRGVEALTNDGLRPGDSLPGSIYCFALGQLPPEYVKFLYALAQRIGVHFLLPNPCDGYWGDIQHRPVSLDTAPAQELPDAEQFIEQGHPLLASLGRGTRDLLRVLYSDELSAIHEPALGEALAYERPGGDTLLARVQGDLIDMDAPRLDAGIADNDVSVQVHACHGPLREVQVLQDQLLDLLGRDTSLTPRDIVVMMPDPDAYGPAIQGVFGAAEGGRYLPYSLSDRARSTSHPIVQSFGRLLDLPLSRWTAEEMLALAAVPAIARRYRLDEAGLASAREWAASAGVRWGYDAGTRANFGVGALEQNTWRFGLDRLLLGIAQSDEETLVDGVAPWSDLEGGATAALGRLWLLLERLHGWSAALAAPAVATDWQDRLNGMIEAMFAADPDDDHEQRALEEVRAAIAVLDDAAGCMSEESLSWEAVREILRAELAQPGSRQPFLSGGITFCGLMPLRTVPFRIVCLLGMDDGAFPRQEANRAFNVLRARPRLGDHSVREGDRLLFLQALTAAREVVYVSYIGQDVVTGEQLPPSPLVGEWLDFLHGHYFAGFDRDAFEQRLIARQPMHPFSERYFRPLPSQPRLFTFAREWQPAGHAGRCRRIEAPPFVDGTRAAPPDEGPIELAELRRFFDHPLRYFLRDRLAVALAPVEAAIEDSAPLQLDSLSAYHLRGDLLERAQRHQLDSIPPQPDALSRARGILPPAPLDAACFAAQAEQVNHLLPVWRQWTREGARGGWLDIDVSLGGERVLGRIAPVWRGDGPRLLRPGRLRMRYKLRSWIDYLAFRCAGHDGSLRLAGLDGADPAVVYSASLDVETAREHLAQLIALFREGQYEPLLFLPDLAQDYLEQTLANNKAPAEALGHLNNSLNNSYQRPREMQDPFFTRFILRPDAPLGATPGQTRFCELAAAVCALPYTQLRMEPQRP